MPAQPRLILTVDLGTSGPKVALLTDQGDLLGCEFEPVRLILLPGGGAEQDPHEWWAAIQAACRRLLASLPLARQSIAAVCCTSQWSGTVAVDRSGQPLGNALIWMDARGAPYIRKVNGGALNLAGYAPHKLLDWIRLTGGAPGFSGKDPVAHILYLKHERPGIYAQTEKFLEPKDYLNLRLTGLCAASYDSITLHWLSDNRDLARVDYHPRLLSYAGIPREKLPDLKPPASVLGPLTPQAAADLDIPAGIPVVIGTPDMQSAALGSGAVRDYEAHLYVGTSSWIICHLPYKKSDVLHSIAALPAAIPGKYFLTCEQETAGACLDYLRDNILYHQDELLGEAGIPDVFQLFDQIAARAPAGSGGVIFTPWLYGERTPVDDHTLRGGLHNLSLDVHREHLIRAVMEGVAYNTRWMLYYVEKFIRRRFERIHIIGGGAQSAAWRQIFADVLGVEIHQVEAPIQANVRGAAFLAAAALGWLRFEDIPARVPIASVSTPNPDYRKLYDALYAEFLEIYRRTAPVYARLNRPPR
ncbi:MAG: FGGY-family carbohydrate kinase [Chloroflexi bacterium]|nr:FGGY-family carbohydrate kinase [Chloroflexota bacterium]